jgi:peptidoglycan/LPS O-acetylase OafA/YrhL
MEAACLNACEQRHRVRSGSATLAGALVALGLSAILVIGQPQQVPRSLRATLLVFPALADLVLAALLCRRSRHDQSRRALCVAVAISAILVLYGVLVVMSTALL